MWLLIGTLLAFLASVKLHSPAFSSPIVRSSPLAVCGWHTCKLLPMAGCRWWLWRRFVVANVPAVAFELIYPKLIILAGVLWNIGELLGVVGILMGEGQSVEWLDAPGLFAAVFHRGSARHRFGALDCCRIPQSSRTAIVYVTQWYILGAVFWFPWLYLVAQFMIFWSTATGVVAADCELVVRAQRAWAVVHGRSPWGPRTTLFRRLSVGLIHSYYLKHYWLLVARPLLLWAECTHLIGGPIPGVAGEPPAPVGSMMMLIPVLRGGDQSPHDDDGPLPPAAVQPGVAVHRVFGAIAYTAVSVQGVV